jgi:hypothetical protein
MRHAPPVCLPDSRANSLAWIPRSELPVVPGTVTFRAVSACDTDAMPTVLVVEGFRFFFFSNEGFEPPHIHVEKGDGHAKWWLRSPPELAYSEGLTPSQLRRVRELVTEHGTTFLESWHEYFDRP